MLKYFRVILFAVIGVYFFLIPAGLIMHDLRDPGLYNGQIPEFSYRWHRGLSKKIDVWASARVESGEATDLEIYDISGTEWPMFGAAYYLWATEALQHDWEYRIADHDIPSKELDKDNPKIYAKSAIEAAARLISDPNNAAWVKDHWGEDYLERENLFYRMLLIGGLTSYQNLSGDRQYESLLREQTRSLSAELAASPYGLLDDYPGECYPVDIVPAIAVIKRAEEMLGEIPQADIDAFVSRSLRGFEGERLDKQTGLPAYIANSRTGEGVGPARGVGMSYMLIWAAELWPDTARDWYEKYETQFWKEGKMLSGFSEFAAESGYPDFFIDVDSGPVLWGYGVAASSFGLAAARTQNNTEHAYSLAAEALVASWPLPNGTLLTPRLLSNLSDAPYLGESALLFVMTRQSAVPQEPLNQFPGNLNMPKVVYLVLGIYLALGGMLLAPLLRMIWRFKNRADVLH